MACSDLRFASGRRPTTSGNWGRTPPDGLSLEGGVRRGRSAAQPRTGRSVAYVKQQRAASRDGSPRSCATSVWTEREWRSTRHRDRWGLPRRTVRSCRRPRQYPRGSGVQGAIKSDADNGPFDGGVEVLGGENGRPPGESLQPGPVLPVRLHRRRVSWRVVQNDLILVLSEPASQGYSDVRRMPVKAQEDGSVALHDPSALGAG